MLINIDRDNFLEIHAELTGILIGLTSSNHNDGAKRHLRRGLNIRIAMIETSILELDKNIRGKKTNLDVYEAASLCLHINSYYINIVGGLYNLAWALLYRFRQDTVSENDKADQKMAVLSNKKLHELLIENKLEELALLLNELSTWFKELKSIRHPSAHRIPLLVPRSTLSEQDVDTYHHLDQEAAELIQSGQCAVGMAKLNEASSLGIYQPVFICENPSIKPYDLATQLNYDHQHWLKTVAAILKHAFMPA